MALCGTMAADLPLREDDAGEDGPEDLQIDLLERARRLCAAANEIALPMLQSVQELQQKFAAGNDERKSKGSKRPHSRQHVGKSHREADDDDEEKRRERPERKLKSSTKKGARDDSSKLPSLALPPIATPLEKKKPAVPKMKKKEIEQEDASQMPLPQINASDEWRKQREAEKIRQAQERAKARLLKSNQVERVHQAKDDHFGDNNAGEDPKTSGEREKEIEESRKRAEERVRQRQVKQEKQEQTHQPAKNAPSAEVIDEERLKQIEVGRKRAQERVRQLKTEKAKALAQQESQNQEIEHHKTDEKREQFRLRTLQRLQAAKRAAQEEHPEQPETEVAPAIVITDPEEAEKERRRQEKRRRRETAERLKRQQAIAEEQQRKERELIEKGLNDFKNMRKEMDRVAKGLQPLNWKEEAVGAPVLSLSEKSIEGNITGQDQDDDKSDAIVAEPSPAAGPAADEISADAIEYNEDLSITIDCDPHGKSIQPTSSGTKSKRKKIPPWRQPPVPILPAESYSHKAVISPPGGSYVDRFARSGRTSPTVLVSSVSRSSTATSTGSYARDEAVVSR